jgi:4-amino-4-deoxy-L-arabinose transferase-like glycosyltransferase
VRLSPSRGIVLALVALAAVLRLIMPPAHPDAFQPDEVVNGYDAFCLAHTGADHHGNPWPLLFESFGDWVSPLLTYVTAPFVGALGLSAFAIRLPGVLANVLAVAAVAMFAFEFTRSRIAALVAAALLATSPWDIALAQWSAAPTLLPLLTTLATLFALRTIRSRAPRDALAFGACCALLVYDYPTQKLFAPLIVAIACACMRGWRERALALVMFAALSVPMFALTFSDPKYNARFAYVGLDPHAPDFLRNVAQRYGEYLNPAFLFRHGDMSFAPFLEPLFAAGIVLAIIALATGRGRPVLGRRAAAFVLAVAFLAPLPASLTVDHLHPNRILHLLPLAVLLTATGTVALAGAIESLLVRRIVAGAMALLLVAATAQFAGNYYAGRHVHTGFAEEQVGLGDAILAVVQRAGNAPVVVDTSAFNQPYIYYLFAAHYDCARLPLAQMRASQAAQITWAYVSAIDDIRFRPVSAEERTATVPLAPIDEGPERYEVRQGGGTLYLLR